MRQRLNELNQEVMRLENKQKMLNEKLNEFADENERIRLEIFRRDREALVVNATNHDIIGRSNCELAKSMSPRRENNCVHNVHYHCIEPNNA